MNKMKVLDNLYQRKILLIAVNNPDATFTVNGMEILGKDLKRAPDIYKEITLSRPVKFFAEHILLIGYDLL